MAGARLPASQVPDASIQHLLRFLDLPRLPHPLLRRHLPSLHFRHLEIAEHIRVPVPAQIDAEKFNRGFSNPAFVKINSYIQRFGFIDFKRELKKALRADFQVCVNMIDNLVGIRNQIAHGTVGVTYTPRELKDKVKLMKLFCSATDRAFATWWKTKFITIR